MRNIDILSNLRHYFSNKKHIIIGPSRAPIYLKSHNTIIIFAIKIDRVLINPRALIINGWTIGCDSIQFFSEHGNTMSSEEHWFPRLDVNHSYSLASDTKSGFTILLRDSANKYVSLKCTMKIKPHQRYYYQVPTTTSSGAEMIDTAELDSITSNLSHSRQNLTYKKLNEYAIDFDEEYYLKCYPDVCEARIPAFEHYVNAGHKEGRNPNRYFNTDYYLKNNPDVAAEAINPFLHFKHYGYLEKNRRPSSRFGPGGFNLSFYPWQRPPYVMLPRSINYQKADYASLIKSDTKVGIHIHAYYMDLLDDIFQKLKNVENLAMLVITTPHEENIGYISDKLDHYLPGVKKTQVHILQVENRVRDVAPSLIAALPHFIDVDLILHLHTKKSIETPGLGNGWRKHLLDSLIGSKALVESIVQYFDVNKSGGLLCAADYNDVSMHRGWGANRNIGENVLRNMFSDKLIFIDEPDVYPKGFMFWVRRDSIRKLFQFKFSYSDFPNEPIPLDGSLAHAIERVLPQIIHEHGFRTDIIRWIDFSATQKKANRYDVSVIIPAKNAGDTINDTLISILNQRHPTFTYEIIISVNGSSDNTLDLCQWYSRQHKNVSVITAQDSLKAGGARNLALAQARGRYILFVDADDLIGEDCIELMLNSAQKHNADLVVSQLRMFNNEGVSRPLPYLPYNHVITDFLEKMRSVFHKPDSQEAILLEGIFSDFGPCAKIYNRDFLNNNKLKFPAGVHFEDNLFVYMCYLQSCTISIMPATSYYYRKRPESTGFTESTNTDEKYTLDLIKSMNELINIASNVRNAHIRYIIACALRKRFNEEIIPRQGIKNVTDVEITGKSLDLLTLGLRNNIGL